MTNDPTLARFVNKALGAADDDPGGARLLKAARQYDPAYDDDHNDGPLYVPRDTSDRPECDDPDL